MIDCEILKKHNKYMKIAINLAKKGEGYVSPNPMVGAIVVKNNKIIGKGYHKGPGTLHAEVEAINKAGDKSKRAVLYVTLEPCAHFGRTPPCVDIIVKSGIKHVVFAIKDPNPIVDGGGENFLKKKGVKVTKNICVKKAYLLNESFIKYVNTGLPFVIAKCATTLDGNLATRIGHSKWVTGLKARQYVHKVRNFVDGIIVGKNTILKDKPSLTTRLSNGIGINSNIIILDTNFSLSNNMDIFFKNFGRKVYIFIGKKCSKKTSDFFKKFGIIIIKIDICNDKLNFKELIKVLGNLGFTSLLIEGGGEILNTALTLNIVDKICFFYAPKILTGNDGISICVGKGFDYMYQSLNIYDLSFSTIGKDFLIQGYLSN